MQGARIFRNEAYLPVRRNDLKMKRNAADGLFTKPSILAPYCASRGGIKQLTMSLADDWGVHGITVNCLAPGWFKTE